MSEIHKLTRDGVTILPATTTDAVVHPFARVPLTGLINEYNISQLYPTSGIDGGNTYTLASAINLLGTKLNDNQKTPATKVIYIDNETGEGRVWRYLGGDHEFTNTTSWSREDSWFTETNQTIDNLEESLISTALRKTDQTLTEEEKTQVRTNIGAASASEVTKLTEDTETALSECLAEVEVIKKDVNQLKYYNTPDTYCVGEWTDGDLSPEAKTIYGNPEFLDKWDVFLFDTTQNTGETMAPVGKLMRNNFLRFEDGSFAPTVGITEERRAECDVALYLDNTQTQLYCEAGTFDPEAFYNQYGINQKLYNAAGVEVNILRPWETTETKYTIGIGRQETVYLLDNVIGESGKRWKGVFADPVVWDGIDVSKYSLAPTAISPGLVCTIQNKTRNFFYLFEGETNCKSSKGIGDVCSMFLNGRNYPRVNDMNQINTMKYSRNNNSNTTAPFPVAEGGYHALNTFITAHEVLYKTKYLHKSTLFSSGISANDGCSNETAWNSYGGVRYKLSGTDTWKYQGWGNTPSDIYYSTAAEKGNWSYLINKYFPKEQCMESQMAASYAFETGVTEGEEFDFYGGTYWYQTPTDVQGLLNGKMNVRVYKRMSGDLNAYNASGNPVAYDIEVILRMGLMNGVSLAGDVFAYWGGGYEQVGTVVNPRTNTDGSHGTTGNPVVTYLENDQKNWVNNSTSYLDNLGTFDFESIYEKLWEGTNLPDGYTKSRSPYSAYKTENGGSISTGECHYCYSKAEWADGENRRYRFGARFRGYANGGGCAPRFLNASYSVASTWYGYAGSSQILLPQAE